jgi:hypothetical protein
MDLCACVSEEREDGEGAASQASSSPLSYSLSSYSYGLSLVYLSLSRIVTCLQSTMPQRFWESEEPSLLQAAKEGRIQHALSLTTGKGNSGRGGRVMLQ